MLKREKFFKELLKSKKPGSEGGIKIIYYMHNESDSYGNYRFVKETIDLGFSYGHKICLDLCIKKYGNILNLFLKWEQKK